MAAIDQLSQSQRGMVRDQDVGRVGVQRPEIQRLAMAASRVREPERAERLWLVMAVAYLWVVSMGTHVLETPSHLARLSRVKGNRLGVFKLGLHSLDRWMGSGGGQIRQLRIL